MSVCIKQWSQVQLVNQVKKHVVSDCMIGVIRYIILVHQCIWNFFPFMICRLENNFNFSSFFFKIWMVELGHSTQVFSVFNIRRQIGSEVIWKTKQNTFNKQVLWMCARTYMDRLLHFADYLVKGCRICMGLITRETTLAVTPCCGISGLI
jgi:hypothetical protein